MLSLILLNEQIYHELKHRIIASQPVRAVGLVSKACSAVMCHRECVASNIEPCVCWKLCWCLTNWGWAVCDLGVNREVCVAIMQAEKQIHLASCLDKLMTDVQRNLEPKNRDRFTQVRTVLMYVYTPKVHCITMHMSQFCSAEFDYPAA